MKTRYRLIHRGRGHGTFYCVDSKTGKRTSLGKVNKEEGRQIVDAKNQAERQPMLNLQLAKAYLAGTDAEMPKRTWQHALEVLTETKRGANKERWRRVATDRALSLLWGKVIVETEAELMLKVLRIGTVSTNVYLRRLYNFCVDMNWLPWPIVPKRQWPIVRFQDKRAITWEEHCRIVEREKNPERKAFYQLAWHLGASQSDLANLAGGGRRLAQPGDQLLPDENSLAQRAAAADSFWKGGGSNPGDTPQGRPVVPVTCKCAPRRSRHGVQTAMRRPRHSRNLLALAIATRGRNGRRSSGIRSDSPNWPWATTVKPSTGPTPEKHR